MLVKNSHLWCLGTAGTDMGRFGTDVGTDETCRIPNVYRPWDGGTDKMGIKWGVEGISLQTTSSNHKEILNLNCASGGLRA